MPELDANIDIRRARAIDGAPWRAAIAALLPDNRPPGIEADAALGDDACYALLAFSPEGPVGLLAAYRLTGLSTRGPLVYLYDIAVTPAYRDRGIGRALIGQLLDLCRADGVRLVWAGTGLDNAAARALFKRSGARRLGERYAEYEWRLAR